MRHDDEVARFCVDAHPRLVGAMSLYTADRHLAEDLAQEALARAWRDWDRVRATDAPLSWCYRVAVNLANSHFRHLAVVRRHEASARETGDVADPAEAVAVRRAVAGLPRRERAALVLRYFADLPVRDVAALLGCPEGTVKTLTSRAVARLRAGGLVDQEVSHA